MRRSASFAQLPFTTWFRLARVIEGSQTAAVLMAAEHLARSSGGATIDMDDLTPLTPVARARGCGVQAVSGATRARWGGPTDRARLLQGLETHAARRRSEGLTAMSALYGCAATATTNASEMPALDTALGVARDFSPRLHRYGSDCVVLDVSGLGPSPGRPADDRP